MPRQAIPFWLLVVAGILLSACSRPDTHSLLPADSLSRAIASELPEIALELIAATDLEPLLEHPRTLLHDPAMGRTYIADTRANRIAVVDPTGTVREVFAEAGIEHPYLAGLRDGAIAILEPSVPRVHFYDADTLLRIVSIDAPLEEQALTYAAVNDESIVIKIVEEGESSRVLKIDDDGRAVAQHSLRGPHWRHAGMMRFWDGIPISLSGYRPVIDRISTDGTVDSLALLGFDSPMLSRSRRFVTGDISDAPLLTSSADVAGDHLFVLNLRAGWIRVDVYGADGLLQRVLIEPDPQPRRRFYPVDLAVSEAADGSFDVFVLLVEPAPRLMHFRTRPDLLRAEPDAA